MIELTIVFYTFLTICSFIVIVKGIITNIPILVLCGAISFNLSLYLLIER